MPSSSRPSQSTARVALGPVVYIYEGLRAELNGMYDEGCEPVDVVLADDLAPEGVEDHIGHRVALTGGEDAPLGLICEDCGEYVVEWET